MTTRTPDAYPAGDGEIPAFIADLGLPGIVDAHIHALPPRLQRAVWRFFDGLDDPPWPIAYRLDADEQLTRLREFGVIAHTGLAYAHRPGMLAWLNDYTLTLAERHPQIVPTFTIYPEPDVGEQTRAAIERGGAAVKVHLQVGRYHATDPRLDDAWEQIAAHRLPIVFHATAVYGVAGGEGYCGIDEVRALLDRHPDLVIVLAHLGMPDFEDAARLLADHPGVFADTAMAPQQGPLPQVLPEPVRQTVRERVDQLVFGTDYPSIPHDYATQLRGLAALELDDSSLRAVLHDTGARLFGVGRTA